MTTVILTAAGCGTRMHSQVPKQFIEIEGKPILVYTMEAFQRFDEVDNILVVSLEEWFPRIQNYAQTYGITKLKWLVQGGASGMESIVNGLTFLHNEASSKADDIVIIHDGNRPMVDQEIFNDCMDTFRRYGNAIAAIPCVEVTFESENGLTPDKLLVREKLVRTQTPHIYHLEEIYLDYKKAKELELQDVSASCALMKMLHKPCYFAKGSETNLKITTPMDLAIFKALLKTKENV